MSSIDFFQILRREELELVVDGLTVLLFQFLGDVFDEGTPFGSGVQRRQEIGADTLVFTSDEE
jgi:hypothetical protein